MSRPVCRRGDCVRGENHHGHCFWRGVRYFRGDLAKPTCPADPRVLVDACERCKADARDSIEAQARAANTFASDLGRV